MEKKKINATCYRGLEVTYAKEITHSSSHTIMFPDVNPSLYTYF